MILMIRPIGNIIGLIKLMIRLIGLIRLPTEIKLIRLIVIGNIIIIIIGLIDMIR
jgi:hypothetical protein